MDKTAKKAYKYLLSQGYRPVTKYNTKKIPDIEWSDFLKSVEYLERCGYAECIRHPVGGMIGGRLTHEGKHKFELDCRAAFRAFFTHYLPGFFSGITAAVLANLLSDYGRSLLSALTQLLQSPK